MLCVALGDCLCAQLTEVSAASSRFLNGWRTTALLSLLTNLLRTVLAGAMLWRLHHATAQQWVLAVLAVSVVGAVAALMLVTRRYGKPTFSLRLLRQRMGEGVIFSVSSSATGIYNNFDKAMLGHYGMNTANGIYNMAYRVVDISTIPITSVHQAAFPQFFKKGVGGVKSTIPFALQILKRTALLALASAVGHGFGGSAHSLPGGQRVPGERSLRCAGCACCQSSAVYT